MISDETRMVARLLYKGAKATPVREALKGFLKNGEWLSIANAKIKPGDYTDAESYFSDNLICSFLRKNPDLDTKVDLEARALESFFESERQCFAANRRIHALRHNYAQHSVDVRAWEVLSRARKIVIEIVGHRPKRASPRNPVDLEGELPDYVNLSAHGPGATLSDPSLRCTAPDKFESVPTMTPDLNPLLVDWVSTAWADAHFDRCALDPARSVRLVKSGKFFTVPKTALSLRGCEKQPSINVYYQKGIGLALRELLRPFIDLTSAKALHGQMAQYASALGHLATLDLERASDTVCSELVYSLWPKGWLVHLDMTRTRLAELPDGRVIRLEKYSSMGNGFTFELETITFYALVLATMGYESVLAPSFRRETYGRVSVLGDDIIAPTEYARDVSAVLSYFGFKLNSEKSFSDGPFRESCGFDAFRGIPVRGFFLEESLHEPADFISCANGLRRAALAGGDVDGRWRIISEAWHYLISRLPRKVRCLFGPESLGDTVLHGPIDRWRYRTRNSIREFQCYRPGSFRSYDLEAHWGPAVTRASKLYGVLSEPVKTGSYTWPPDSEFPGLCVDTHDLVTTIVPRGDPLEYHIVWVSAS